MSLKSGSKSLIYFVMFLSGIVVGSLIGKITEGVKYLGWLSYGLKFGTKTPVSIDIGVIAFDFGFSLNLTIACIICVLIALIIGKKVL